MDVVFLIGRILFGFLFASSALQAHLLAAGRRQGSSTPAPPAPRPPRSWSR
jgi:hypothetical protein